MEKIGNDLKKYVSDNIKDIAIGHLECWQDRYKNYKKVSEIRFDLNVNHDSSLEIERAEDDLKRPLNNKEYDFLIKKFNIAVCKEVKNLIIF